MKRPLFLIILFLAVTVLADNFFTATLEETGTATVDGTGADTARFDDTVKINAVKGAHALAYRFRQTGPSHTKRGAGLTDTAWVRIKSRLQDFWITVDSFKVELPDTTVRYIVPANGDTLMFGDLYAVVTIRDTSSDSIMTISWDWWIDIAGK